MSLKKEYSSVAKRLGINIEYRNTTGSTNQDARDRGYRHGDIIVSSFQSAGRGQRGNSWESEAGNNLTFSIVVEPTFLPASMQFLLSEVVSLAVVDLLNQGSVEAEIKWPNDIYVNGDKVAGILIEHDIMGSNIARSILGIGLNVNQCKFDSSLPNPTSLSLITGENHSLPELLESYYTAFVERYDSLESGYVDELEREYHSRLYKLNELHKYTLPSGEEFDATLIKVEPSGELILKHSRDKMLHSYLFKEVQF